MKYYLLLMAVLSPMLPSWAQQSPERYAFTLEEAISHALEHNYSAINATRDIEISKQKKRETTATGLPQLNGTVDYTNNIELQQQPFPAILFDPTAPPDLFVPLAFSPKQSMNANLRLSQLIFDGSYIVALQASKTYLEYYQNAKTKSNNDVREMVINAYGTVLLTEESIAILERNKASLEKTLNDTRETFKNGLIEEENVEQLEITLSSVDINLNNTRRLRDISYKMLKVELGLPIEAELVLEDKLEGLTVRHVDPALTGGAGFDVNNNIDFRIARNFEEQRSLELKLEKSRALPTLGASLNYGALAFGQTFDFTHTSKPWYDYAALGVNLTVPIFSGFARSARTQQAKIRLEQAKTQLTETEQRLKLAYEKASSDYEFSIEQYETSKNNLRLAERIEGKQQTKFTEGLSTSFDLNDAQRQLYTAQQQYLQSMVDIINKKAALEKIINTTK